MSQRIAVVGLGYVGLPVAMAMARTFAGTVGFDIDRERVDGLRRGYDATGTFAARELQSSSLLITNDPAELGGSNFYIIAAPTPVDAQHAPDFAPLLEASRIVGRALGSGDVVVYESTVYPGATEELCIPVLEQASGLSSRVDFSVGYSPERVNPGDREHTFERVVKLIAAQDGATLERMMEVYGRVVEAGLHPVKSIKIAEASKLLENIQRDVNVALVNEVAQVLDRLGISTVEVIEAACTKWNFAPFWPGLVGGHCVAVDPHYFIERAKALGLHPELIPASRRVNDAMSAFVAEATLRRLRPRATGEPPRVAVLGLAFKANVPDTRNSRVPALVAELRRAGAEVVVHDPVVDREKVRAEQDLELVLAGELARVDAVVLAVPHAGLDELARRLIEQGTKVVIDVKAVLSPRSLPPDIEYWSL